MPNEKEILSRLVKIDNAALQEMIRDVAQAIGMSSLKTKMLVSNPDLVRRKLQTASEEDVVRLLASLDESALSELMEKLQKQ